MGSDVLPSHRPAGHQRRPITPALTAERVTQGILLALLGVTCLQLVGVWVQAVRFPFNLDYAEPPLLNQALLLARGQDIYRSDWTHYPFVLTEYPPVYLALVAAVFRLVGPSFLAGRVVALAAVIACALLIIWMLRRLTQDPLAAIVGAGLWLAAPYVLYWSALARLDLVALGFSLAGMAVAVRWPHARWSPFLSALWMILAVSTRQTYLLAGPLSVTGWYLAHNHRRAAALFVATLATGLFVVFATLNVATQGGFFLNTIASNAQSFSFQQLFLLSMRLVLVSTPLLAIAGFTLWRSKRDDPQPTVLLGLYLAGAIASSLTIGKIGAGENYFLELVTALSLMGGFALARWRKTMVSSRLRALYEIVLIVQVGMYLLFGQMYVRTIADRIRLQPELVQLQALVAQEQGPILADEQMGLLVMANKEVLLRPFHFSQLARQGKWDQSPVLADIRAGRFGMILISDHPPLYDDALARGRWTPEMWEAIHEFYRPTDVIAGTTVFRPLQ